MKGGGFSVKRSSIPQGQNSLMNGPMGQMVAMNMLQQRAGAQNQQLGSNAMPTGGTNPYTGAQTKTPLGLAEGVLTKQEELKTNSGLNLGKAVNLLGNTVSHVKGMWDEQAQSPLTNNPIASAGGLFPKYGGKIRGGITSLAASQKIPGFDVAASLPAQLTQMALSEMGIVSGQNRLIEGVFKELKGVNVGTDETPGTLETKVRQTVYDLAGLDKATQRLGLTHDNLAKYSQMNDDQISQLNPQDKQAIMNIHIDPLDDADRQKLEPTIQTLLGLPPATKYKTGVPGYSNQVDKSPIPGQNVIPPSNDEEKFWQDYKKANP
jgi:hypothetical protein